MGNRFSGIMPSLRGVGRYYPLYKLRTQHNNNIMHVFQNFARNKSKLHCFDGSVKLGALLFFAAEKTPIFYMAESISKRNNKLSIITGDFNFCNMS